MPGLFGRESLPFHEGVSGLAGNFGEFLNNLSGATAMAEREQQSADKQMAFQERLSDTAFQRSVADMHKAGINPLVAFGGASGGASTPMGAAASGQPGGGSFGSIMSGVSQIMSLKGQLSKLNADTLQSIEQTKKTTSEIPLASHTGALIDAQRDLARWNSQAKTMDELLAKLLSRVAGKVLPELESGAPGVGQQLQRGLNKIPRFHFFEE